MSEIELGVERQLVYPGDRIGGRVHIGGKGSDEVTISLHGEEIFRPYLGFDTIMPIHEESQVVRCQNGKGEFSFLLPDHLSPSYHSEEFRCAYYLKGIRGQGQGLGEASQEVYTRVIPTATSHSIARLHLTVGPPFVDYQTAPHTLILKDENNLELEVQVDQVTVEAGECLTGSFLVTRLKQDGPLPKSIVFSLAAIEESTNGKRRAVLWRLENSIQLPLGSELAYPLPGSFEFPVDLATPTTGQWSLFKVHCGFRVRMDWGDRNQRESLPIQLCRRIIPRG